MFFYDKKLVSNVLRYILANSKNKDVKATPKILNKEVLCIVENCLLIYGLIFV